MILGVGVDILNISRIGAVVKRGHLYTDRFARRILCASELEQFKQLANKQTEQTQYLATRWGVKEALYKAAYPHQVLRWGDICVFKTGPKLKAQVAWKPQLTAQAHISISHDRGLLVSYVIVST